MVSKDTSSKLPAPNPESDPPYPSTPPEQHGFRHAYGNGKQAAPTSAPEYEEIDDWEKDEEEEEDYREAAPRPFSVRRGDSDEHSNVSRITLPESLRAGPRHQLSNQRLTHMASQISLPVSEFSTMPMSDISSTISLPQQPASFTQPPPIPHSQPPSIPQQNYSQQPSYPKMPSPGNPFLRKPIASGLPALGREDSTSTATPGLRSEGVTPTPTGDFMNPPPVELPATRTPVEELSRLALGDFGGKSSPGADAPIPVHMEYSRTPPEVVPYSARPNRNDSEASNYRPLMDLSSMDAGSSRGHRLPDSPETPKRRTWQEQQEHERSQRERRELEAAAAAERARKAEQMRLAEEEYHREEAAHAEMPPPQPPRPAQSTQTPSRPSRDIPEHYSIKKIRWYDDTVGGLRMSPVLVQNANGPCPLLALVNALVLSTPVGESSGLIDALSSREQVSLNLLIDAVFDELMTGRRSGAEELPDVSELYAFLKALHTGMNVNPRFIEETNGRSHAPRSAPGGFESTKEMRLYSTFGIPLVHGWLPVLESPDYRSFARSAATYEDAQNIQFHEEELEERLDTTGLSAREQDMFEDLHSIKNFLQVWPTQLTDYGLQILHEHLKPGSFAILFRNDHFSTLYKEPKANQLMTLVTDQGYATHEEIIWESLLDVNGQSAELFSGDFRPVSHSVTMPRTSSGAAGPSAARRTSSLAQGQNIQSMLDVDSTGDWSTVQGGRRPGNTSGRADSSSQNQYAALGAPADDGRTEQEDHDLALAMQLQEEEEERARQRDLERQREDRLSAQLLDGGAPSRPTSYGAGRGRGAPANSAPINIPVSSSGPRPISEAGRPAIPPRRTGQGRGRTDEGEEPPPPTYEQAATRPAFVPPAGHPLSQTAPVPGVDGPSPQGQGAPTAYAPSGGYRPPGMGRGYNGMGRGNMMGRDDRDKCLVM
jgi:hypothetical protein